MLECFLEQHPAISATLPSQDVSRSEKDLCMLTKEDATIAEGLVRVMKPLKKATLAMLEDKQPTVSVIAPLLALLETFTPSLVDSNTVRDLKAAVKKNLGRRYAKLSVRVFAVVSFFYIVLYLHFLISG